MQPGFGCYKALLNWGWFDVPRPIDTLLGTVVFAQLGAGAMQSKIVVGKLERGANARNAIERDLHSARDDMGVGHDLGEIVDRPGGNAFGFAGGLG